MILKKKQLTDCKLYLILDTQVLPYAKLVSCVRLAVQEGVDIVQLRDKTGKAFETLFWAKKIKKIIGSKALFIVNDRIDIAILSDADGVHLGQDDLSVLEARRLLGENKIIGFSCQTLAQLKKAEKDGADYIGFGSVFLTKTKPDRREMDLDLLKKAVKKARIPLFPIGGIKQSNVHLVVAQGAKRLAVCREILLSKDVKSSVEMLKVLFFK